MNTEELIKELRARAEKAEFERGIAEDNAFKLQAELKRLREAMETLASYANTVRTDRKHSHPDSLSVMCLQTIDWCEGLKEYVREARKVMEALEVKP